MGPLTKFQLAEHVLAQLDAIQDELENLRAVCRGQMAPTERPSLLVPCEYPGCEELLLPSKKVKKCRIHEEVRCRHCKKVFTIATQPYIYARHRFIYQIKRRRPGDRPYMGGRCWECALKSKDRGFCLKLLDSLPR